MSLDVNHCNGFQDRCGVVTVVEDNQNLYRITFENTASKGSCKIF